MPQISKMKRIMFSVLVSVFFLILVTKAATPYTVSVDELNDGEFPRVQASLKIQGDTNGLLGKHISIHEDGKQNLSPLLFLPPHAIPQKIDLTVLLDQSGNTFLYRNLIQANLKSMVTYFLAQNIDLQLELKTLGSEEDFLSIQKDEMFKKIDALIFSPLPATPLDGFGQLIQLAQTPTRPGAQKILLVINGTTFMDSTLDGVTGSKMKEAISSLTENKVITLLQGAPVTQLFKVRSKQKDAELVDFSHQLQGGYLGGYGADLSATAQLLLKQNHDRFLLQYYSQKKPDEFLNTHVQLSIDNDVVQDFTYSNAPDAGLEIRHVPENEIALGQSLPLEIDLDNRSKSINAVEMHYKKSEGDFQTVVLRHDRNASTSDHLKYSTEIPPEAFIGENFTYYLSVHTPYTSTPSQGPMLTVPITVYDDGIHLKAALSGNEVVWTWSGPTVDEGKKFELWAGEQLLLTTDKKEYRQPLNECNRYQIMQVKVIFPDQTKSYPSRPTEYYSPPTPKDAIIHEKDAVELMIRCLEKKVLDSPMELIKTVKDFNATRPLTLERGTYYLTKVIGQDKLATADLTSNHYSLLHYIMNFLNKDQYVQFSKNATSLPPSLVYKLITKANQTSNLSLVYKKAFDELSTRLRGNLTF